MGNIVLLDDLTINKIAAGEVIERPASVIKELVENSIDAGATFVNVEIKNGGISYIRVTDNGKGIMPDDMEIAFERHATSKIRKAEDLETVKSMGFRGEALASIAAISKIEMKSKTRDNDVGYRILIEGGDTKEQEETGCPNGTTITIENLFYNTPVRYKFLRKDFTEAGYIEDVVTRIALVNPDIAIKLINSGKTIIQTSGNGDVKALIYSIYGKDIVENVLDVNYEYEDIKVSGVVGKPAIARSNRTNQLFFVNKRYIKDKTLTSAAEQAFKGMITIGKFGFLILNIEMNPQKVDVNVHPAKLEVRFEEENKVFKAIYHAVKDTLLKNDLVRDTQEEEDDDDDDNNVNTEVKNETVVNNENTMPINTNISNKNNSMGLFQRFRNKNNEQEETVDDKENLIAQIFNKQNEQDQSIESEKSEKNEESTNIEEKIENLEKESDVEVNIADTEETKKINNQNEEEIEDIDATKVIQIPNELRDVKEETKVIQIPTQEENISKNFEEMYSTIFGKTLNKEESEISENNENNENTENTEKIEDDTNNVQEDDSEYLLKDTEEIPQEVQQEKIEEFKENIVNKPVYKFIGIAFSTYIIIELDKEMYIIDQHAAHERIMYEKIKENYYNDTGKDSQLMLLPDVITLTHKEMDIAKENMEMFEKAGFILEEFGENTIKLTGVPNICLDLDTKELFLETLDEINTVARTAKQEIEEKFIATVACKAAVKANMALTESEVDNLLKQLLVLPNPFTCPHGRPTAIKMTKTDIEKKFSRR